MFIICMDLLDIDMGVNFNRFVFCFAVVAGLFFFFFPSIDIDVTTAFYLGKFDSDYFVYDLIYNMIRPVSFVVVFYLFFEIVFFLFMGTSICLPWKSALFFLLCWLIGPGLIVNVVFKDHYGRPRPNQISNFGGKYDYVRAFELSKSCHKNCSFVSGHASVGFVFLGLSFIYRKQRYWITLGSLLAGGGIGYVRVAQGGHFLSDVVFSFIFTYLGICLSHWLMLYFGQSVVLEKYDEIRD